MWHTFKCATSLFTTLEIWFVFAMRPAQLPKKKSKARNTGAATFSPFAPLVVRKL